MKYDFDEPLYRKDTDCLKWDLKDVKVPMWVADMDFKVAPCIQHTLQERVDINAFGYSLIPDAFYKTIQRWWLKRHGIGFDTDMMIFSKGVLQAMGSAIRRFTCPGEGILVQSPIYHVFYSMIENNGRKVVTNDLIYNNGKYTVDFNDLEEKLSNPNTTIMILSNPHNPVGIIWDKETLNRIGSLCDQYNVLVLSDEIHCDIVQPGFEYVPFAKVNETCRYNSITFVSATKAFNLAGLDTSCVIVPNEGIRAKLKHQMHLEQNDSPNFFSCAASISAFKDGDDWLEQMNEYVYENKNTVIQFFKESIPELKVIDEKATYMVWVDCSAISDNVDDFCDLLLNKYGLFVSKGSQFGENGKAFIRMNLACPRQLVLEGLLLLRQGIRVYKIRREI